MKNTPIYNRIDWIDAVKGIAILCIMWRHVQGPSDLRNWICTFHVPIFLIISGYLSACRGCPDYKAIFRKNIPPYIVFSLAAIIIQLFSDIFLHKSTLIPNLLIGLYKTISGFGISALWFIPSYFIAHYIFIKFLNFNKTIYVIIGVLTGGICSLLVENIVTFIHNSSSSIVYNLLFYPIIAFFRGYGCVVFIAIGYLSYYIVKKLNAIHKSLLSVMGLTFLIISWPLSKILGTGVNFSMLTFGNYPGLYYLVACISSSGIIYIVYLINKLIPLQILKYYGRNSQILMITHMSLDLTSLSIFLVSIVFVRPETACLSYYLHGFLCLFIMLILEIPIINLLNGTLNYLINSNSFLWKKLHK